MKLLKLIIDSIDLVGFSDQVSKGIKSDYKNESSDMIIIGSEVYKFRTNSTQMNMVIIKLVDSQIHVDIIGAAGSTGLLGISWWSESGFTKSMNRTIENICEINGLKVKIRE